MPLNVGVAMARLEPQAVRVAVDAEDVQVAVGVRHAIHPDPAEVAAGLVVELVGERESRFGRTPVEAEGGGTLEELSVGVGLREAEICSTDVHERKLDLLL